MEKKNVNIIRKLKETSSPLKNDKNEKSQEIINKNRRVQRKIIPKFTSPMKNSSKSFKFEKHYLALKLPKKVTWSEDTVNNEGMGKKKSNICCIYIS